MQLDRLARSAAAGRGAGAAPRPRVAAQLELELLALRRVVDGDAVHLSVPTSVSCAASSTGMLAPRAAAAGPHHGGHRRQRLYVASVRSTRSPAAVRAARPLASSTRGGSAPARPTRSAKLRPSRRSSSPSSLPRGSTQTPRARSPARSSSAQVVAARRAAADLRRQAAPRQRVGDRAARDREVRVGVVRAACSGAPRQLRAPSVRACSARCESRRR